MFPVLCGQETEGPNAVFCSCSRSASGFYVVHSDTLFRIPRCKQLSFELLLPFSFVFLIVSKLCPILSGLNDAISPRELPLIGHFLFLGDGCGKILVDQPVRYQQPSHSQSH